MMGKNTKSEYTVPLELYAPLNQLVYLHWFEEKQTQSTQTKNQVIYVMVFGISAKSIALGFITCQYL